MGYWALLFGLLVSLLPAAGAFALNGDACDALQYQAPSETGRVLGMGCVRGLDNITTASGGPIVIDLNASVVGIPDFFRGLPDSLAIMVGPTDCAAGTVTVRPSISSTGPVGDVIATLDVDASAPAGVVGPVYVDFHQKPFGRYVTLQWTGVSGCGLGFDIPVVKYRTKP